MRQDYRMGTMDGVSEGTTHPNLGVTLDLNLPVLPRDCRQMENGPAVFLFDRTGNMAEPWAAAVRHAEQLLKRQRAQLDVART